MQISNEGDGHVKEAADALRRAEHVLILVHNSTDGDTLGSALALALALRSLEKRASVVCEEPYPEYLNILPTDGLVLWYKEISRDGGTIWGIEDGASQIDADLVVAVDCGDVKLLGKRRAIFEGASRTLNVDHHPTNKLYGDVNCVSVDASATAEIVYLILKELAVKMNREIALCLYTGVSTDTGGFSYANTTARAHMIAAETLPFGMDVARLRYVFFDAINPGKLRCHGYVAQTLRFFYGGKFVLAVVTLNVLRRLGATEADCDGLVDIGRNVIGVQASAFAREIRPGEFRVNLRSRNGVDVSAVAARFGGGGHKAASGCTLKVDGDAVAATLVDAMSGCWPDLEPGDGSVLGCVIPGSGDGTKCARCDEIPCYAAQEGCGNGCPQSLS